MFKLQDVVQPKTGGPKMIMTAIEGDTLLCVRADDTAKKEISVPATSVNLYHEDGDFGVC